jgi:two-component system LytT family response regulator
VSIRALVADDEPPARELVRELLAQSGIVNVVGEASDGLDAVELIHELRPDLVLLDVQMPEMDGFAVVEAVGPAAMPAVVFVTAHDQYALRAFEVHALDYVLKPIDEERFSASVRHAVARLTAGAPIRALTELLDAHRAARSFATRLPVKRAGSVAFVDVARIAWIESDDKVIRLHTTAEVHEVRATLRSVELRLDPRRFIRVHRSTIVNAAAIREIVAWSQNDYLIVLQDGTKLMTGRAWRAAVDRLRSEGV